MLCWRLLWTRLEVIFEIKFLIFNFVDLREQRKEAKKVLGGTCIICSLDREAFQQKAKDFSVHLDRVPNNSAT